MLKYLSLIILFLFLNGIGFTSDLLPAKAVVLSVDNEKEINISDELFFDKFVQTIRLKILNTHYKNTVVTSKNYLEGYLPYDNIYKEGDILLINLNIRNEKINDVIIRDYFRINYYYILLFFLIGIIILFAGKQGFKSFFALFILTVLLFFFTKYIIIQNRNPVIFAIFFSLLATIITFFIITKDKIITYSSIIGSLSGLISAFIVSIIFSKLLFLDKFQLDIYREILMFSRFYKPISINNILLIFNLTALISAVGIVMDVSITISSAVREIYLKTHDKNFKKLYSAGMNIGKDIFGTMSNVYILIFTGQFLPMLLFLIMLEYPLIRILNLQLFISDITIIVSGLIGMVVSIFITSIIVSKLSIKNIN